MAAMRYDTLVADKAVPGSIRNWSNYGRVPAEEVLSEFEAYAYNVLRTREMRDIQEIILPAGERVLDLPEGWLDLISMWDRSRNREIFDMDSADLPRLSGATAGAPFTEALGPAAFTIIQERFRFDAPGEDPYGNAIELSFYRRPDPLGPDNQENWLTRRYPDVVRAGCQYFAAKFHRDGEATAEYKAELDEKLQRIIGENKGAMGPQAIEERLRNWTDFSRVPAVGVVQDAMTYIMGALRTREMRVRVLAVADAGDASIPLPRGFLELRKLYDVTQGSVKLQDVDEGNFQSIVGRRFDGGSVVAPPSYCSVFDERINLDTVCDRERRFSILFHQAPEPLAPGQAGNWLTRRYTGMFRSACLMQAYALAKDWPSYERTKSLVDELIVRANGEADYRRDQIHLNDDGDNWIM